MLPFLCLTAAELAGSNPVPVLRTMELRFGISIETSQVQPSWNYVRFSTLEQSDSTALSSYSFLLSAELSKYPVELITKSQLRTIALVKNLTNDGLSVAAVPDYKREVLYLDVTKGNVNKTYAARVIHHDFYHMLEEQFNGSANYKDLAWCALNAPEFAYGSGGRSSREEDAWLLNNPSYGFVSKYAMSAAEEDKAEVFSAMLSSPKLLEDICGNDNRVAKKVAYLKESCGRWAAAMNEAFWDSLARRKRG